METIQEKSYGIIPVRRIEEKWQVLMIQHQAGHWSFPKGHSEVGETAFDSAKRELQEETGVKVKRLLREEPFFEEYKFQKKGKLVEKTVTYFLAEVEGEVFLQTEELKDARWMELPEANNLATFPEAKRLSLEILDWIP